MVSNINNATSLKFDCIYDPKNLIINICDTCRSFTNSYLKMLEINFSIYRDMKFRKLISNCNVE